MGLILLIHYALCFLICIHLKILVIHIKFVYILLLN